MNHYLSIQSGLSPKTKADHGHEQINTGKRKDLSEADGNAPDRVRPDGEISYIGDALNMAFFSTEIDAEKVCQSISDSSGAENRPIDRRIAVLIIALVIAILVLDLIFQYV